MKKSNYDFTLPTRQSYAAILIITYRLYRIIVRQLFPLFIIFFIQGRVGKSNTFLISIIVIASLGAIYSIVAFFRYFFYIEKEKLIVKKGVFKRSTLEIPFDRIQSINFEQNLIHRIFSVVKLNMDTAGSSTDELQLNALDQKMANALSKRILENRNAIPLALEDQSITDGPDFTQASPKEVIFNLSIPQLIKVGVTENHLRSGGVIIFFFFWIYDSLREVGLDFKEKIESYLPMAEELSQSLVIVLAFVLLFLVSAFIISLIRTVLRFYDLKMYRVGNGFSIENGLLNKKEQAAKDQKIQIFKWSQNLLQSFARIYELQMKQATSGEGARSKSFNVVGLTKNDVDKTRDFVFEESIHELDTIPEHKVEFYYLFKRLYYWTLTLIVMLVGAYFLDKFDYFGYIIAFWIFGIIRSHLSYKKKKFGIGEEMMLLKGGVFGRNSTLILNHKIQNVRIYDTPFQRRRKLSSLAIYTASGTLVIPDIRTSLARQIMDFLIYKVEKGGDRWM